MKRKKNVERNRLYRERKKKELSKLPKQAQDEGRFKMREQQFIFGSNLSDCY